jgi:hypothetical protein
MPRKTDTTVVENQVEIEPEVQVEPVAKASFKVEPVGSYILRADGTIEDVEIVEAPAAVKRVRIMKRFRLNRDNHTTMLFDPKGTNCDLPGYYDVPIEDADHPYLLAHTDNPPQTVIPPGTLAFAEAQHRKMREQSIQNLIEKNRENDAVSEVRRRNFVDLRERLGGDQSGLEDSRT